ncbi:MAG: hypothetical protein JMDDDDMK_01062 [Acidobacteria bacterium]|nr:hypothetical protein [Acidobacteriota bacterium]
MRRPITDRAHQRQFAPAFEHVAQQHGRQSQRAEQQSQSAESLKCRKVSVFDLMKACQLLFSSDGVEAEIRQLLFQRRGDIRRAVNQEEAITFLIGKKLFEVRFRHQQLALEDAVGKRGDHAKLDRRAVAGVDRYLVAEFEMQNVSQRIGVGDDRRGAIAQLLIEQRPGIGLFPIGLRQRRLKRETRLFDEAFRRAEDSRIARLIEIQATRVITGPQPKPRELHARKLIVVEVQLFPAFVAVQIVNDRQQRFSHQRITAIARFLVERPSSAISSKSVNRNDDERGGSDQRNAKHAATGPRRRVAKSHPSHRPRALALNRPLLVRTQPRRPEEQNGDEQQRARAEKSTDLPDQLRRGGGQQSQSKRAENHSQPRCREKREP